MWRILGYREGDAFGLTRMLWCGYHNPMSLKKTTVMVDEADLELVKRAAAREGRPESEYFREAFHLAAIRTRRWDEVWDIPVLDYGHAVTADEIDNTVREAITNTEADAG